MKSKHQYSLSKALPERSDRVAAGGWLVVCIGGFFVIEGFKYWSVNYEHVTILSNQSAPLNRLILVTMASIHMRMGFGMLAMGLMGVLCGRIIRAREDARRVSPPTLAIDFDSEHESL